MANLLSIFRSNAAQFRAKLTKVREDLERARRRREELQVLPPPPDEICDRLMAVLDERANEYKRRLFARLRSLTGECAKPEDSPGLSASMQLLQNQAQFSGQEAEGLLAYLFRDQVRAGMLGALKGMDLKCGPALQERAGELQELEARIAELATEEKAMLAELNEIKREASE